MKAKKFLAHVMVVLLFVLYLFNANTIALAFDDNGILEKKDFDNFSIKNDVYEMVDGIQYLGGLYEVAYFQGWAFCETEQDNTNKTVSLIFVSEDGRDCYAVETKPQQRPDVYGVFRETTKIYNDLNGVECQFSTVNMKNGTYKYYVYVWENEMSYGIVDTGMRFMKNINGLHQIANE